MKVLSYPRSISLLGLVLAAGFLGGCSANFTMPEAPISAPDGGGNEMLKGGVFGGQAPITAAHVYIFEAHAGTGYGTTVPTSLLGNKVSSLDTAGTCNASVVLPLVYDGTNCYYQTGGTNYNGADNPLDTQPGQFDLTGLYSCVPGDNVWLFSISGYPNAGAAALNPYAGLLGALGQCPSTGNFSAVSFIYMNELSTVAMAYATAGFAAPTTGSFNGTKIKISTRATTNAIGLTNAFNNAEQLYDIFGNDQPDFSAPQTTATGAGTAPYYQMNTIADMLASCINSGGQNTGAPAGYCSALFTGTYGGTSVVTDTASAAINLAQNAAALSPANLNLLLTLSTTVGPWFPNNQDSSAPYQGNFPDLSLAIAYTIAGPSGAVSPQGVVVDASGNAFFNAYQNSGYVVKMGPLGTYTTSSTLGTLNTPSTNAIDSRGYIWTDGIGTTGAGGYVYEINGTSSFTTQTSLGPLMTAGITHPVAADKTASVYYADSSANEIFKFTNGLAGTNLLNAGVGHTCLKTVNDVAVDTTGDLWTTGAGGTNKVCRLTNTGTFVVGPSSTVLEASGVAVDSTNNAWVIQNIANDLIQVTTGGAVSNSFNGGGLDNPNGVIVDGANRIFVANTMNSSSSSPMTTPPGNNGSISEFSNTGTALSGSYGFQSGFVFTPKGIAIDVSGNIWIANFGGADVLEVIGIATPTATLVAQKPGTKP